VVPVLAAASTAPLPAQLAQNAPATDAGPTDAANDKVAANAEALADSPNGDKAASKGAGAASAENANKITADDAAAADVAHDTKATADSPLVRDATDPPAQKPQYPVAPTSTANSATADLETAPPPPLPRVAPAMLRASKSPIAIFISRKTAKIYVRQDFEPVFSAPVTIEDRDRPFGTFVFTALQYLPDRSGFVWNVVSVPEREKPKLEPKPEPKPVAKYTARMRRDDKAAKEVVEPSPPQNPQDVLARIEIPQDAVDQISQMIVPGSSLVISDQGLGDETGEGTDFVVVMH
jgi:hypothetical protein